MKKIIPFIQILTGTLMVILIVNDFVVLLFDFAFDIQNVKVPIQWSKDGMNLKYWLIDHQPAFSFYQGFFMGTGFVLIFSALFGFLPRWANLGIVGGLIGSALFVLLFPSVHSLIEQTPSIFMHTQIIAGLVLLPAALNRQNIKRVQTVGVYIAAFLMTVFLIATLATSIETLIYGILPVIGALILLLNKITQKRFAS